MSDQSYSEEEKNTEEENTGKDGKMRGGHAALPERVLWSRLADTAEDMQNYLHSNKRSGNGLKTVYSRLSELEKTLTEQSATPQGLSPQMQRLLKTIREKKRSLSRIMARNTPVNPEALRSFQIDYDGNIYIDGEILDEHYGKEVIEDPGIAKNPITLGPDEYFVLGDNRNDSQDSRDPAVGVIHRKDIIGRVWLRIYPFDKFGLMKGK